MAERRRRWTEFDPLSIFAARYLECECGAKPEVKGGSIRSKVVDRQIECDCGRRWRQLIY